MKAIISIIIFMWSVPVFAACSDYDMQSVMQGLEMSKASNNPVAIQYSQGIMDNAMRECYGGSPVYMQYLMMRNQPQANSQTNEQQRYRDALGTSCYMIGKFLHCN